MEWDYPCKSCQHIYLLHSNTFQKCTCKPDCECAEGWCGTYCFCQNFVPDNFQYILNKTDQK